MAFPIYDSRTEHHNILVTPQIRSKFLRIEPGPMPKGHSHDLGHEIFLVLQGRAEFEIDGDRQEVKPGEMCIALVNQLHSVHALGDEPVVMYLSVTPHIQPTHTLWEDSGARLPHRFVDGGSYDTEVDESVADEVVTDRYMEAVEAFSDAVSRGIGVQGELGASLKRALSEGDQKAVESARDAMWDAFLPMYERIFAVADVWNDLAARTARGKS